MSTYIHPTFRVICDWPGCDEVARDDRGVTVTREYEADAVAAAMEAGWQRRDVSHFCPRHPRGDDG